MTNLEIKRTEKLLQAHYDCDLNLTDSEYHFLSNLEFRPSDRPLSTRQEKTLKETWEKYKDKV